jgi:hypothetical protein
MKKHKLGDEGRILMTARGTNPLLKLLVKQLVFSITQAFLQLLE